MNCKDLEQRVAKAQQKLQEVELRALNAERVAKSAKAKAQQLKLEHRRAKRAAKAAKRLAASITEEAQEQCRVLEKAERRLAKALAMKRQRRPSAPAAPAAAARRLTPGKPTVVKGSFGRGATVPLVPRRPVRNGHPPMAGPQASKEASTR